jgi:hypothetical protein
MAWLVVMLTSATDVLSQNQPQVPRLLSYQGVLVNPDGTKIPDGTYLITIRLYDTPTGGTPLWEEQQSVVTLDGVFDYVLGLKTSLDNVPFDRQYWLSVQLDNESEMSPRTLVVSAPYALRAQEAYIADSLRGGVVRSLNGIQGPISIVGGSGTVVTESGSTIQIDASGTYDPTLSPGAIYYGDPQSDPTELPIGDPDEILTVNAAGTQPEWKNTARLQAITVDSLDVLDNASLPLNDKSLLAGNPSNRAEELPSTNRPGQVLIQDSTGRPVWSALTPGGIGIVHGRVSTTGQLRQTVNEPAVQAGSRITVHYVDPSGGATINIMLVTQNPGVSFDVRFSALPPEDTYIEYVVYP